MTRIDVIYEGNLHTLATHESTGQTLHTDAPKDNGGEGKTFSPTDLLATSLATCIATIMGIYAQKHEIDLRGMKISVEKHMSKDSPRRIVKLPIQISLPNGLSEEVTSRLQEVAKSCPVHHSLHPAIEVSIVFK